MSVDRVGISLGPVQAVLEDRGGDFLIIAFQSAGRITREEMQKISENELDEAEVREKHSFLNWNKLSSRFEGCDILYVKDHLSRSYGWYVMDSGKYVHSEINFALRSFLNERRYERVISFGSSKGGTAALLFGLMNSYIDGIVSLVPQIKIGNYWRRYYSGCLELISGNKSPRDTINGLNNVLSTALSSSQAHRKRTILYTGVLDDQFEEIGSFVEANENQLDVDFIVNCNPLKHTPLVVENLDLIYGFLSSALRLSPINYHEIKSKAFGGINFVY